MTAKKSPPAEKRTPKVKAESNTATLHATGDQTSIVVDGEEYMVDADGDIEVPASAVAACLAHGFEPA